MTKTILQCALVALGVGTAGALHAQSYPQGPITLIVPFAAGGPTDVIARVIAKGMADQLKESIVVENKGGAGGRLGIGLLKTAKPDGYTIGMATGSTQAVAPALYAKLPYDPLKDFKPIGQIVDAPGVLIASKAFVPDCKLSTFVAKLKEEPGKYTFGSAGIGALSHMSGEEFQVATKTDLLHVPYKGLGAAINDLYGGIIVAMFDNVSSSMPHIQAGKVCGLAVQSAQRLPALPDIPTYAELGLPELNRPAWYGLLAPGNTPDAVVDSLNTALNAALRAPDMKDALERLGIQATPGTPAEFHAVQEKEIDVWKHVVRQAGIKNLDD